MGFYSERGFDLESAKGHMLVELENWYGQAALDTFDYTWTNGTVKRYFCNEAAQLRMINGRISNVANDLFCGTVLTLEEDPTDWAWVAHTSVDCGKVHQAYLNFSKDISTQYNSLKTEINTATSVSQIDTIFEDLFY